MQQLISLNECVIVAWVSLHTFFTPLNITLSPNNSMNEVSPILSCFNCAKGHIFVYNKISNFQQIGLCALFLRVRWEDLYPQQVVSLDIDRSGWIGSLQRRRRKKGWLAKKKKNLIFYLLSLYKNTLWLSVSTKIFPGWMDFVTLDRVGLLPHHGSCLCVTLRKPTAGCSFII